MSLTLDDVTRVAHLARIATAEEEKKRLLTQLEGIFNLISQLQAVNTEGIAPMSNAQEMTSRLRVDEVTETDQHDAFQAIAPQVEAGLYLVPQVIE